MGVDRPVRDPRRRLMPRELTQCAHFFHASVA
jgi:hypothetical protein